MKFKKLLAGCGIFALMACSQSSFAFASFDGDYLLAEIKFKTCQSQEQLDSYNLTPTEAYTNFLRCKSEAKKLADTGYKSVNKTLKKPSGKAALKEFHAAFMTRIESSEAKDGELKFQYSSRMAVLDEKVESAQQKLLLELPK